MVLNIREIGQMDPLVKAAVAELPKPPVDIEPPTPPDYVRIWIKQFGSFDGNIEKARLMQRDQLTKEDAELLLFYGVTRLQIAKQYQIPSGSLSFIFKKLGVDMRKMNKEDFINRMKEAQVKKKEHVATVACNMQHEKTEKVHTAQEIWFREPGTISQSDPRPILKVKEKCLSFNSAFMKALDAEYVHLCAVDDGRIRVKRADVGIRINVSKKQKSNLGIASCRQFVKQLTEWNVKLPASWVMHFGKKDGIWTGERI